MDGDRIATLFDATRALLVEDGNLLAAQLLGEEAEEQGVRHTDRRLTIAVGIPIGQASQWSATLVCKDALASDGRAPPQRLGEAKVGQDVHAVGREVQTAADAFSVGIGFVDGAGDPCFLEKEGRAADAATGDQDMRVVCAHEKSPFLCATSTEDVLQ
jgi:hypothetical protein